MQSIERRGAQALIAAIGLIVAALVYVDAHRAISNPPSALADEGAAQGRSSRASEAEAATARTNLSGRMQSALGDAFAGTWFEPSTAQLHVGVISPASRRIAEAVAARAGLSELVTAIPVNTTWLQLAAEQERWDRRLADLFQRGQVSTSLVPDRSSVKIELASSVPTSRRALLERDAAAHGSVEVIVSPRQSLFAIEAGECAKWVSFAANCDPEIVAGTTLASEKDAGGKHLTTCTTGPAVRTKDRSTAANTTRTYVLTAGHCIAAGGGVGKKWYAFEKGGQEKELGPAGVYLNGETDVGIVEVKSPWTKTNNQFPVTPATAFWSKDIETKPNTVSGEAVPKKDSRICVIGQRSMEVCGKVADPNVTVTFKGETEATKNLFKVELDDHKDKAIQTRAGAGDSGGPIRSDTSVSTVEGVFVGFTFEEEGGKSHKNENEGKIIYFHSLATAFTQLNAKQGLDLELLRSANEKRTHPVATAAKYPVTFSAEDLESTDRFTSFESATECIEIQFHGELTKTQQEAAPAVVELTPTYKNCVALGGIATTFAGNGCKYKLTVKEEVTVNSFDATADVVCPAGKAGLQFDVGGLCTITLPPQTGLNVPRLTNDGEEIVMESGTVQGVRVLRQGFLCGSGETTTAIYDLNDPVHISGSNGGAAVKVDIGGQ